MPRYLYIGHRPAFLLTRSVPIGATGTWGEDVAQKKGRFALSRTPFRLVAMTYYIGQVAFD